MVEERGDAFEASPSLFGWYSLYITLGCPGHPKLRLLPLLIPSSIVISPKTCKLQSHKTQQNLVRSVSIIKQITTLSIVANPFIFYFLRYTYCILSYPWLIPPIQSIVSSKQAKLCIKNITVYSNLNIDHTYVTPKILNN